MGPHTVGPHTVGLHTVGPCTAFSTSRPRAPTHRWSCFPHTEAHGPDGVTSLGGGVAGPTCSRSVAGAPPVGTGHGRACWDRRLSGPCPQPRPDRSRSSGPADGLEFFKSIFKQTKPEKSKRPNTNHIKIDVCVDAPSLAGAHRGQGGTTARVTCTLPGPPAPGCSPLSGWACQARPHWAGDGAPWEPFTSPGVCIPAPQGSQQAQLGGAPPAPHL